MFLTDLSCFLQQAVATAATVYCWLDSVTLPFIDPAPRSNDSSVTFLWQAWPLPRFVRSMEFGKRGVICQYTAFFSTLFESAANCACFFLLFARGECYPCWHCFNFLHALWCCQQLFKWFSKLLNESFVWKIFHCIQPSSSFRFIKIWAAIRAVQLTERTRLIDRSCQ